MNIKPIDEIMKQKFIKHITIDEYGNPHCAKCDSIYVVDGEGILYEFCPDCGARLITTVKECEAVNE